MTARPAPGMIEAMTRGRAVLTLSTLLMQLAGLCLLFAVIARNAWRIVIELYLEHNLGPLWLPWPFLVASAALMLMPGIVRATIRLVTALRSEPARTARPLTGSSPLGRGRRGLASRAGRRGRSA